MFSYIGSLLALLGLIICLFSLAVPIAREYTKDERGFSLVFAIFKHKPYLVFFLVGVSCIILARIF